MTADQTEKEKSLLQPIRGKIVVCADGISPVNVLGLVPLELFAISRDEVGSWICVREYGKKDESITLKEVGGSETIHPASRCLEVTIIDVNRGEVVSKVVFESHLRPSEYEVVGRPVAERPLNEAKEFLRALQVAGTSNARG